LRTSALARLSTVVAVLLGTTLLAGSPASADEPALPVAVADTVTIWPGQSEQIDVLANDVSPSGDDLALCRFPEFDFLNATSIPGVIVSHTGLFSDPSAGAGELTIVSRPAARGTHVVDYYICDHTHLVPATLTVVVRDVEPVDVTKVKGKRGRLQVTNHNDQSIRFWYGDRRALRPDGRVTVPAGATRVVRVQRYDIMWIALIGSGSGKAEIFSSPGIAGHGSVHHIKLKGDPLPRPKKPDLDDLDDLLGRWSA
jgi:hypothetical protein